MNNISFLRAHKILSKVILQTPLIFDEHLSKKMNAKIFLKALIIRFIAQERRY